MKAFIIKQNKLFFYKIGGAFICLALWEAAARILNRPIIIPQISEVLKALLLILQNKTSYYFIASSVKRIIITLVFDSCIAFPLGIIAGLNKRCEAFFSVTENILKSIPTMTVLLLSLIWFKSEITPLFVTSLIVFPVLYRNITDGVKNIDKNLIIMSEDFSVPFMRRLKLLYLPCIKPFIKNAYSIAFAFCVKVLISAEVLSQPKYGIGTAFQIARVQLDTASLFAWAFIAVLIAAALQKTIFNLR
ncbi:ABC transporter permease [Treponema pedis]|uniref:ABC transporter permease n=1 Tax=Treponema pedis TaxID=409322 RepID=UPI0003FC8801|nr:ABC transporter permease subunit [Treponema pedis]